MRPAAAQSTVTAGKANEVVCAVPADLGGDNLCDLGTLFQEGEAQVRGFGVVRVERYILGGRKHAQRKHVKKKGSRRARVSCAGLRAEGNAGQKSKGDARRARSRGTSPARWSGRTSGSPCGSAPAARACAARFSPPS